MIGLVLGAVMLAQIGCVAGSGSPGVGTVSGISSRASSEEIKRHLGTIGVTATQVQSQIEPVDISTLPEDALDGDGEPEGLPFWCGLPIPGKVIVCLPMAAVSLIRAASADSREEIRERETAINENFATEPLGDLVRDQLVASLGQYRLNAVRIERRRASTLGEQPAPPVYKTLLETEMTELRLSFVPAKESDRFQLHMTIQSKLRRHSDGVEVSSYSVTYESPTHSLADWAADEAEIFRAELHRGAKRAAAKLVDLLVVEYPQGSNL